jgi:hypothetical protein
MTCPDCNANLDAVSADDPCPECGGGRRTAAVLPQTAWVAATLHEPSILLTRDDHRPWFEKWREVVRARDLIGEAYHQRLPEVSTAEVEARVTHFFSECHDMRDWLVGDRRGLPAVTIGAIDDHVRSSSPLGIASAVANSHKHHTRDRGATARIRSTQMTPDGARVTIELDWATLEATQLDALEVADECLVSWREFFATHGITES